MTELFTDDPLLNEYRLLLTSESAGQVKCHGFPFDEDARPDIEAAVNEIPRRLPQLWPPFDPERRLGLEQCDYQTLAEVLANSLLHFGLYGSFPGTIGEARNLAGKFVARLIEPEWSTARIYSSREQWGPGLATIFSLTAIVVRPEHRDWRILILANED